MTIPSDWYIRHLNFQGDVRLHDPRGVCPHCRNASTFKLVTSTSNVRNSVFDVYSILKCNSLSCDGIVYITSSATQSMQTLPDAFFIHPSRIIDKPHPAVPAFIADDWREAQTAMEAGAPKAAAVMCRRVLYGAILDKECKERPLREGLQQLIDKERLPAIFDDWLPAIADDGHDAAHPHLALEVDPVNIAETMEYTSELLRTLYIEPYEFQQRKERKTPTQ